MVPGRREEVAFESDRDVFFDIFVMNADGSGQTNLTDDTGETNLTNDPAGDFTPDWQPLRYQY